MDARYDLLEAIQDLGWGNIRPEVVVSFVDKNSLWVKF
jgi:hypothetical protein